MGHLAVAALERGDGEWENIQDVLRDAFLVHERQLRRHEEQFSGCGQRERQLSATWTDASEKLVTLQGLPAHVDTLARVVNTLSEEVTHRAQADQERQQQQAKWMDSVTRALEAQLDTLHTRVLGDVETACGKALASMERRMTLVEEELGHLATALDQKADLDALMAHKQVLDEALKQRCRKAAFDKEVVRVHQMVRAHHTTMSQRMEDIERVHQQQTAQHIVDQQQVQHWQTSTEGAIDGRWDRLEREILAAVAEKCKTLEELSALNTAAEIATVQEVVTHRVTALVAENGDELLKLLRDADMREKTTAMEREWHEWRLEVRATEQETRKKIDTLQEELTRSLTGATNRLAQWEQERHEDHECVEKRFTELKEALLKLHIQVEQVTDSVTQRMERVDSSQSDSEQRQATFRDELWELARARDKKTRQQMHLVADKLREMDQILKLVGKQLVQNTSELQLLWIDQHEASDSLVGDEHDVKRLESNDMDGLDPQPRTSRPADVVTTWEDDADAALQRRHEQLQQSVAATLRDYEAVLSAKDTLPSDHV